MNMIISRKIVNEEMAYDGHFKIKKFTLEDANGKKHINECFERGNSVAAVIFHRDKQVFLFTQQYRIGPQQDMIEIVAGSMDKENETPSQALIREVEEELGYQVITDSVEHIASVYVSPGGTSEKVHIMYAEVENKISSGGGVEGEDITVIEMTAHQITDLSQFNDAKTVLGIQWFLNRALINASLINGEAESQVEE